MEDSQDLLKIKDALLFFKSNFFNQRRPQFFLIEDDLNFFNVIFFKWKTCSILMKMENLLKLFVNTKQMQPETFKLVH
jgi:hypothetical protein